MDPDSPGAPVQSKFDPGAPGNITYETNGVIDSVKAKQQHKEIERRRRNRMKAYFEEMEQLIPNIIERNKQKKRKLDKIAILSETNEYIKELRGSNEHGYLCDSEIMEMIDLAVSAFFFILDFETKKIVYFSANMSEILGHDIEEVKRETLAGNMDMTDFIQEKQDHENLMDFIGNAFQPDHYMFDVTTNQFEGTRFNSRAKRQIGNSHNPELADAVVAPSSTITPTRFRNIDLNQETTIRFNYSKNSKTEKPNKTDNINNCYCCENEHFLTKVSGRVCCLTEIAELNPKNSSNFHQKMWFSEKYGENELLNKKFFFGMARMNNEEPFSDVYADPTGTMASDVKVGLLTIDNNFMVGSVDDEIIEKFCLKGVFEVKNDGSCETSADMIFGGQFMDVLKNKIDMKIENFGASVLFLSDEHNDSYGDKQYQVDCSIELILNAYDDAFEVAIIKVPL
jgi:hypothetical protein